MTYRATAGRTARMRRHRANIRLGRFLNTIRNGTWYQSKLPDLGIDWWHPDEVVDLGALQEEINGLVAKIQEAHRLMVPDATLLTSAEGVARFTWSDEVSP